jgi:hypothetical protein
MKKIKISNISVEKLAEFFGKSILYGDQTLDITKDKLYCKASNVTMSNIIYREMLFDESVIVDKDFPEHMKFFIQDYKILYNIVKSMSGEKVLNISFTYDGDVCKEMVFDNKTITFNMTCSEIGLSKYIDDERFGSIKYPTDIVSTVSLPSSKISEIKSLHKLSKSDNEKMNLVFIYQMINKIIIEHQSIKGGWKIELESENIIEDTEKYALSLDLFDNLGNGSEFQFKIVNLGGGSTKACYLVSNDNGEAINISRIEKKEF